MLSPGLVRGRMRLDFAFNCPPQNQQRFHGDYNINVKWLVGFSYQKEGTTNITRKWG